MKNIIFSMLIIAIAVSFIACGDTLGINGADYTKSQLDNQVITRDTMINFKKVIIETVITKTDTVITYIPVNRTYEPVYSNRYEFQLTEIFVNQNSKKITEKLRENVHVNIISLLDYNPLTPELSFKLKILNEFNLGDAAFKDRNEIIKSLEFEIKKLPVLNDSPLPIRDFVAKENAKFELLLINRVGSSRRILAEGILGDIVFHDRTVVAGQLRSLAISGAILLPAKEAAHLQNYTIEFTAMLYFPAF
jgi:hypothetical protein